MNGATSYLGVATLAYLGLQLTLHASTYLRPSTLKRCLHASQPTYAFITGASDGIGQAFAHELCARGFEVIIHGRNPEKLRRVQEGLAAKFPKRDVRVFVCDAFTFTPEKLEQLLQSSGLLDLHITVLINNIGGAGNCRQPTQRFSLLSSAEIDGLIALNDRFTLHITHLLLPKLTACKAPAMIMNISSQAGIGLPYLCVYSGTKGLLNVFSHALAVEMKSEGHDVEVINMVVGAVSTNLNRVTPTFFTPSSATMAKSALARVGSAQSVAGYWPHALQSSILYIFPAWLADSMLAGMMKTMTDEGAKSL